MFWRTVHTVDAQESSLGLDRVDSNLHYMPAERGVMLHNLQLYQAESGHDTFLRRCHHVHHLNIGADGRGLSTGWPPIPGRLSRSRRLSARTASATRRTRHNSRLTTSCASTVGSALEGSIVTTCHRLRVRHWQHGSMLHRGQLHEGRLHGTTSWHSVRIATRSHAPCG
jgi:hypothetical protein